MNGVLHDKCIEEIENTIQNMFYLEKNTKDLLLHVIENKCKFSAFTEYRIKQFNEREYMYRIFWPVCFLLADNLKKNKKNKKTFFRYNGFLHNLRKFTYSRIF